MKDYVYHVVTEKPMYVGQKIIFDSAHTNGVCKRVLQFQKIQRGEAVEKDFERLFSQDFEKWKKVCLRELAMEKVRKEFFPQLPSRLACLYTSRTLEQAREWAQFFKDCNRNVFSIVLLCVEGNTFDVDACGCFDGSDDEKANEEKALLYWQNKSENENSVIETLADGEITVLEIIEDFTKE